MTKKSKKNSKKTQSEIFWEPLVTLRNKLSRFANKKSSLATKYFYICLITLAALLPFLGWLYGAYLNPNGWLSENPGGAYFYAFYMAGYYWYITLGLFALFIGVQYFLKAQGPLITKLLSIFVFILSLIFSIIAMTFVRDASSSEFTG